MICLLFRNQNELIRPQLLPERGDSEGCSHPKMRVPKGFALKSRRTPTEGRDVFQPI